MGEGEGAGKDGECSQMSTRATKPVTEIAERKLRDLMDALGIDLGPGELRWVSPAQAALLDWFAGHPFATVRNLKIENGEPIIGEHELSVATTEKFRLGVGKSKDPRR